MGCIASSSVATLAVPYFPCYLTNGIVFGKKLLNMKYVFIFSTTFSETFLILIIIQQDVINVRRSSCKVPVIHVRF